MKQEPPQYIPPVEIHNYKQFLEYARQAAIVTFEPIYFTSPLKTDVLNIPTQWLRSLQIYAIGVKMNGVFLTLTHKVRFYPTDVDPEEGIMDCVAAEDKLTNLVTELEKELAAVPGTPELPSLHEEWIRTLR